MTDLFGAPAFWPQLLQSPSFWQQTIPLGIAAIVLLAAAVAVLMRSSKGKGMGSLARVKALPGDTRGAAAVLDFTLTITIFIAVLFVMLQLALMANASLIIHYSAYSAARAAKTQMLDMDNAFLELEFAPISTIAGVQGAFKLYEVVTEEEGVAEKVRIAAAFPLIALAPGRRGYADDRSPAPIVFEDIGMDRYLRTLAGNSARGSYLLHKAKYAFSRKYTKIAYGSTLVEMLERIVNAGGDVSSGDLLAMAGPAVEHGEIAAQLARIVFDSPAKAAARITTIPVFAEVQFRFPLLVPYAAAIFNQSDPKISSRDKGIWLHARVELF